MIDAAGLLAAAALYAVLLALALAALPAAALVRPGPASQIWALARIAALPLVTWFAWLAHLTGIAWGWPAALPAFAALLALAGLACRARRVRRTLKGMARRPGRWLRAEALFLGLFLAVLWIRSFQPDLQTLEKFMNLAFVNAILHTEALPAPDPWFAGATMNYYFFGHAGAALAIRFAGLAADTGTNVYFAHVFAAAGLGAGSLVAGLVARATARRRLAGATGAVAAATLVLGGNFHAVIYGILQPALAFLGLGEPGDYFYAHSTRFIGYHPPTDDKTITEFPGYSVTVGDLHAHVMNLPLAVALLMLAAAIPLGRFAGWRALARARPRPRRLQGFAHAAALTLLFGFSGMANSWDVPIYLTVTGMALIAASRADGDGWVETLLAAVSACLVLLALSLCVNAMFWLGFTPFTKGIGFVRYGSPLWQLAALYANWVLTAGGAALLLAALPPAGAGRRRVLHLLLALLAAAAIILAVPETVFVRDLYGETFARANTMFKLSYQLYVILPVAAFAGGTIALVALKGRPGRTLALALWAFFCLSPLGFVPLVHGKGFLEALENGSHLDGLRFLKPGDRAAVDFLDAHRPAPGEAMLEATGDSYSYAARLSAATGIPTVLGWFDHEWLWRKDIEVWKPRADAIEAFYKGGDAAARRAFLAQYRIRYVVVGEFERERYPDLDEAGIRALGTLVFEADGTAIVETLPAR
jgi:uncharacterized membrane protein